MKKRSFYLMLLLMGITFLARPEKVYADVKTGVEVQIQDNAHILNTQQIKSAASQLTNHEGLLGIVTFNGAKDLKSNCNTSTAGSDAYVCIDISGNGNIIFGGRNDVVPEQKAASAEKVFDDTLAAQNDNYTAAVVAWVNELSKVLPKPTPPPESVNTTQTGSDLPPSLNQTWLILVACLVILLLVGIWLLRRRRTQAVTYIEDDLLEEEDQFEQELPAEEEDLPVLGDMQPGDVVAIPQQGEVVWGVVGELAYKEDISAEDLRRLPKGNFFVQVAEAFLNETPLRVPRLRPYHPLTPVVKANKHTQYTVKKHLRKSSDAKAVRSRLRKKGMIRILQSEQ